MRTITHDYKHAQILNLRSEGERGPYMVTQTGIAPGDDVRTVEDKLVQVVPDEYKYDAHHWLILHGRYICIARKPMCPKCVSRDLCEYEPKTQGE